MARLLVIDDDELVRASLQILLEAAGHEIMLVENGRTGVASVKGGGLDLVICDVFMPEMDGFETLREIRRADPSLPVVVISGARTERTGAPGPDFLKMAVDLGAVASLVKPLDPDEVVAVVESCLAGARRVVRPAPS
ncbi:MAG: response regulator [Rhodoplanes sp.]|uniref:response regulator n=1 Tax=Rhodoplanes sp. TaxID=1968906 RepID=UPI0017D021D3|nr:response regulator [Rhodoplanes sp.]NVO13950.1 response regulator [Rhodoplanes sp.]